MKEAKRALGNPLVLVVDDSPIACEAVKSTLESSGFRVITLESAFGFIRTIREQAPALILMDVGLASMNGTKLVLLARQHVPQGTSIVLYSGRSAKELAADARECGADGYICKQTTDHALVTSVRGFIGVRQR
jgi:DNA-binding response OmpR family regulator